MKKVHLIVAMTAGGFALFLLSIFLILAAKGQLNNQTLTRLPIIGRVFGPPVPVVVVTKTDAEEKPEEVSGPKPPKEELPPLSHYNIPAPFSSKELTDLSNQLDQTRTMYEQKLEELKKREEELNSREKDIEGRWTELNTLANKIDETRKKLDTDLKSYQQNKAELAQDEQSNINTIAAWYASMTDVAKIASLMEASHPADKAARIIEKISEDEAEKGGAILAALTPKYAAEIMSLTLKRKKGLVEASQK